MQNERIQAKPITIFLAKKAHDSKTLHSKKLLLTK